jgi:hypothetical protein
MIDWDKAIARNRDALLRIVAALFAMSGLGEGDSVATLPRHLRNHLLRILRPAEAAVRRLVIIAARRLVVVVKPRRPTTTTTSTTTGNPAAVPALPLIDSLKRFEIRPRRRRAKSFPRISVIGVSEPRPIPDDWFPSPDDLLDAASLGRRLISLKRALDDLDGHAKRFARWRARRDIGRTGRFHPMRPGRPPGYRKRVFHDVDEILRECHALAHDAQRLDTS